MALSNNYDWEVRTAGNALNGGGFVRGASGTDYSQQNSAQLSNTDLVIDASDPTKVTSAGSPFTAQHVGNIMQVSAGSGFTTGFFACTAVASGTATFDRSVGSTSSTGGTFKLGGALLTIDAAITNVASLINHRIFVKAGTYTIASPLLIGAAPNLLIAGYNAVRGDFGTRPLITTATNSTRLFTNNSANAKAIIQHFNLTNTASVRSDGILADVGGGAGQVLFHSCILDGFSNGCRGDFNGDYFFSPIWFVGCEIKNCTTHGIWSDGMTVVLGCYLHDNGSNGMYRDNSDGMWVVENTIIANNGASGAKITTGSVNMQNTFKNCVFYNNIGDGIFNDSSTVAAIVALNCIFEANGGYGINIGSANANGITFLLNNAYFNNTSGLTNNIPPGELGAVTLTGSPFTNASGADFSLNATSGAGAACRAAGFPGVLIAGGTGYLDLGALQHQDTGGGGGGSTGPRFAPSVNGGAQ